MLGVLAVLLSLLVSCTDLINLSQGLDDLYEGMKPTLAKSEPEQKAEPENEPEQEPEKEPKNVDLVELSVSLNTINTDSLWGYDWKDEWLYSWDESNSDYGPLGYSVPELMKCTIYNVDTINGSRNNSYYRYFGENPSRITLNTGSTYDMLFYNHGTENIFFIQSDDNGSYIATTTKDYPQLIPDPDANVQPDELIGAMVTGIKLGNNSSEYTKEKGADDSLKYVKNMDVALTPYSLIYLFQIVIINNDDLWATNRVTGAKSLTVAGLADGVDMFTGKKTYNSVRISTDDIKPMQYHNNVCLDELETSTSAYVMAARVLTWGFSSINWIDLELVLRSGNTYKVSDNVSSQMRRKPNGGVITIVVDASNISRDLYDSPILHWNGVKDGHAFVDMGLSVKWAMTNVGASFSDIENTGHYYAWGETEYYYNYSWSGDFSWKNNKGYSWSSYKYSDNYDNSLTKYNTESDKGIVDNKTILEPEDDVAQVKWGGGWRMPTKDEFKELIDSCTWTEITWNGIKGIKVTSNVPGYTERSLFLPYAGYYNGTELEEVGSCFRFWSSSLADGLSTSAAFLINIGDFPLLTNCSRFYGLSVRPVLP